MSLGLGWWFRMTTLSCYRLVYTARGSHVMLVLRDILDSRRDYCSNRVCIARSAGGSMLGQLSSADRSICASLTRMVLHAIPESPTS